MTSPPRPNVNALWIEFRMAFERLRATSRAYERIANIAPEPAKERLRCLMRELDAELCAARRNLEQAWRAPTPPHQA